VAPFSFSKDGSRDRKRPSRSRSDSPRSGSSRSGSKRTDKSRSTRGGSGGAGKTGGVRNSRRNDSSRGERGPAKRVLPEDEERRQRNFETPAVPADITGDELEKKFAYQIASLTPSNAKSVARHLIALERFLEIDPERAYLHGKEISFRAGRLGLVRERAGVAALRAGRYKEALKELRAASRITGSIEIEPFIAQCEAALGNARKALEIAGSVAESKLSKTGRVEMRIAASKARESLKQFDAAVLTLKCKELNENDPAWSKRLRRAYYDALIKAGRSVEAEEFLARYPQFLIEESESKESS
jgi:tetratricopeptide (TPR) repeat protein